jgi:hypothetical protein
MLDVKQLDQFIREKTGQLPGGGVVSLTGEVPQGAVDGVNTVFTLSGAPNILFLYLNGLFMSPGVDNDYVLSGNIIQFNYPPAEGSVLYAIWG